MSAKKTTAADVWRKSHGYDQEELEGYLADFEPVMDDPRYKDASFEIPPSAATTWKVLQAMEAEIIRMMKQGPPYQPRMDLDGSFGLAQLHHLYPQKWVEWLKRIGMPDTQMSDEMVSEWEPLIAKGVGLGNGDLFSHHPFALNDPGWTLLIPYLMAMLLDPDLKAPFGTNPARLEVTDTDSLKLAIIGDAGTGEWFDGEGQPTPGRAIFQQAEGLGADYTIHLGDVYFLGRSPFQDSFLEAWKPGRRGSFNLNSNHDMYAWGKGYFEQALQHPSFSAQQGTSYFSLEFGDWVIVGLDAAYYDESPLISAGTVSDTHQKAFLREIRKQVDETKQKTFLLTHHHPVSLDGTKTTGVWTDILAEDALGKPPDVWYWGHQHNGVVYSSASALGADTVGRVMGHAGLPFVPPADLEQHTGPGKPITCHANTPYNDDLPEHRGRAMNGFAVVTLTKDGGMTERFINQDGSDMCG